MKRITVLLASIALIGSVFVTTGGAAQASASDDAGPLAGTIAFECQITLFWPTASGGADDCNGAAAGAGTHSAAPGPFTILTTTGFNGHVDNYSEGCVVGPPLTGQASGTANVPVTYVTGGGSTLSIDFDWIRVGLTAVITTGDAVLDGHNHSSPAGVSGAGVAAFVPVPPNIPQCGAPGQLTAIVAGTAAAVGQ